MFFDRYDELKAVDSSKVVGFVQSLQQSDGSFYGDKWGEVDLRFTFCAVATLALLVSLIGAKRRRMLKDEEFNG